MKQIRNVKVYDRFLRRGSRGAECGYYIKLPEIRLCGKWLLECGFEIGHQIEITVQENKLTLTLVPDSAPEKDYITRLKEMMQKKWEEEDRAAVKSLEKAAAGYK